MSGTLSPKQWFAVMSERFPDEPERVRWDLSYRAYGANAVPDARTVARSREEIAGIEAALAKEAERQRTLMLEEQRLSAERMSKSAETRLAREASHVPAGPERSAAIVALRAQRVTLEAIGAQFGIGKERVRQILAKEERKAAWRARNAVSDENLEARLTALPPEAIKRIRVVGPPKVPDFTDARTPEDEWRAIQAGR